jgi:protein-S-isoprenylcysteine O-methyltransferase Ste14
LWQIMIKKRNTLIWIFLAGAAVCAATALDVYFRRPETNSILVAIGIALIFFGFILREASHVSLGKNFTYEVSIVKEHQLITSGIHKYMRHPAYTGLFLVAVGMCVALASIIGLIAAILILLPVGFWRVHVEEKALIEYFGKKYLSYKKRVKAFVPYVF